MPTTNSHSLGRNIAHIHVDGISKYCHLVAFAILDCTWNVFQDELSDPPNEWALQPIISYSRLPWHGCSDKVNWTTPIWARCYTWSSIILLFQHFHVEYMSPHVREMYVLLSNMKVETWYYFCEKPHSSTLTSSYSCVHHQLYASGKIMHTFMWKKDRVSVN